MNFSTPFSPENKSRTGDFTRLKRRHIAGCRSLLKSLVLKQQWTIEEISIFCNSSHLEWRAGLSDTILKEIHTGTIPVRFGLI
jgi:hypothetical protein